MLKGSSLYIVDFKLDTFAIESQEVRGLLSKLDPHSGFDPL